MARSSSVDKLTEPVSRVVILAIGEEMTRMTRPKTKKTVRRCQSGSLETAAGALARLLTACGDRFWCRLAANQPLGEAPALHSSQPECVNVLVSATGQRPPRERSS
jgi:hypothetical protein